MSGISWRSGAFSSGVELSRKLKLICSSVEHQSLARIRWIQGEKALSLQAETGAGHDEVSPTPFLCGPGAVGAIAWAESESHHVFSMELMAILCRRCGSQGNASKPNTGIYPALARGVGGGGW
jgi:hypothetical protein